MVLELPTLTDETLGTSLPHSDAPSLLAPNSAWQERRAARCVVSRAGRIALLYVSAHGYHKLPGGGIEPGESTKEALARELMEEIGCHVSDVREVARITEERSGSYHLRQHSVCFIANQSGEIAPPQFTAKERAEGFEVVWADSLHAAIDTLATDNPSTYEGHFIQARDVSLLRAVERAAAG